MQIGGVKINGLAALAPMAGVTDRAFREICALCGAAYFTSEMISVKGLIYGSAKTFELADRSPLERPFALQLFGSEPADFEKAVGLIKSLSYEIIDINMGCPATKIVKENSGSALMKTPEKCGEIVYAAKKNANCPVTVKIRAGWDESCINAVTVAKICEQAGASAITVHGRTKAQGYSGRSNPDIIKQVKQAVKIPVIGNGDVCCAEDAKKLMDYTDCDMVAVGRGAMGNPWVFEEINNYLSGKNPFSELSFSEKIGTMKLHIEKICEYKGESCGIKEARKHIACYIKNVPNAAEFRKKTFEAKTKQEILTLLETLKR